MSDKSESNLENPENWDMARSETKEPQKAPRVVVSVAFQKNDFTSVSACARRHGKKTSEFIRDAALEQATGRSSNNQIYAFGNSGSLWLGNSLPSVTRVHAAEIKQLFYDVAMTSS
jgi:hypothetical protein